MCEKCQEAADKYLAKFTEDEKEFILWELTAFPFADAKQFARQCKHVAKVGIAAALKERDADMDKAFAKIRAKDGVK